MDINETKNKITQYHKLITETSKRRNVLEEKIAKFGELHAPTHIRVEYNDVIADIKSYEDGIASCKDEFTKHLEGEIQKNKAQANSWRLVLPDILRNKKLLVESIEFFLKFEDLEDSRIFDTNIVSYDSRKKSDTASLKELDRRIDGIYLCVTNIKTLRAQITEVQNW